MRRFIRVVQDRSDLIALAVIAGATFFLPQFPGARTKNIPGGVYGLGIVSGAALALNSIGLILVYRAHRIINFAQAQLGLVAGTVFVTFASGRAGANPDNYPVLFRKVNDLCSCIGHLPKGLVLVNYWISLTLALGFSLLLAYIMYTLIVRRFSEAPRLVLTVATIFVIQLLAAVQGLVPRIADLGGGPEGSGGGGQIPPPKAPFNFRFDWDGFPFQAPDILTVVLAVVFAGGIMVYYQVSRKGAGLRASAENPVRAATVGVDVNGINSWVWLTAGALSGVVGVLSAMQYGVSSDVKLDVSVVVHMLAVAVVARMTNLAIGVVAAIGISLLERGLFWAYGTDVFIDGVLFLVIMTVLMMGRYRTTKAEIEQASGWRPAREVRPVPVELKGIGTVRAVRWGGGIAIAILLLSFPWLFGAGEVSTAGVILIYALIGLSLLILTGWAGQISLGQFAFAAVGAYVAAVSRLPMPLAVIVGGLGGALVAIAVGVPALKLRGLNLAITTLSFSVAVVALLLSPTYLGRFLPEDLQLPSVFGINLEDGRTFYYVMLAVVILVALAVSGMRRSQAARALIATRDNESAAQSFGIGLLKARLGAFAISGFIAALAGGFYAFQQHGVRPEGFPAEQSVTLFTMAVIGGLGSVAGPLIGATYLAVMTFFGSNALVSGLLQGGGGLGLLMFVPGGLSQLVFGLRDNWLRRVAQRRGISVPSLMGPKDTVTERVPIAGKLRLADREFRSRYRIGNQWALDEHRERSRREERAAELKIAMEEAMARAGSRKTNESDQTKEQEPVGG